MCKTMTEFPPLSENALFEHPDYTYVSTFSEVLNRLKDKTQEYDGRICSWFHTNTVKTSIIHFSTGRVVFYDSEGCMAIIKMHVHMYEQYMLDGPTYISSNGYLVVTDDGAFMPLHKWNINRLVADNTDDVMKRRARKQTLTSLMVPFAMYGDMPMKIDITDKCKKWYLEHKT
jgi:hypothetical protein